ncbi:hypothetical protein A3860_13300 [Niastella vici]|uniref:Lipocalin-like domain-containing protein n=1 Tax=Niastella vici TaxID=1703345 RepID=A0A1V9G7B4_9BACT|nr:hypothetical protein [Niastella vici]OQP66462.1 hypothetical protein A3860_13300 [Niastella vici]
MKKVYAGSLLALSVLTFACNKSKDKSTSDLLQGKWYATTGQSNDHYSGQDHPASYTYNKGDVTLEFKGAQLYINDQGSIDTFPFKVLNDTTLFIDNAELLILKKLTGSELTTYSIYNSNSSDFSEETTNFNKY